MRRVWHPVDECLVAAGLVLMGIGAVGAGLATDGDALAARCPVCGLLLQADGEIPRHLPPGHPAGGARNGVAT